MAKTYFEKLKDPRWQKRRLSILERDKWRCRLCWDDESTLHVHHIGYAKGEPWDVEDKLLITLCADCHEREEAELKEYSYKLITALRNCGFMSNSMRHLMYVFGKDRGWHTQEPNFSVLETAIDNDEIWDYIEDRHGEISQMKFMERERVKAESGIIEEETPLPF